MRLFWKFHRILYLTMLIKYCLEVLTAKLVMMTKEASIIPMRTIDDVSLTIGLIGISICFAIDVNIKGPGQPRMAQLMSTTRSVVCLFIFIEKKTTTLIID